MNRPIPFGFAIVGAVSLLAASTSLASTVYEASYSSPNSLPYYYSPNPYGDEITLAGTDRVLTGFSFSYYSDYAEIGGLEFGLFANDGPLGSPGTPLFTSIYDVLSGPNGIDIDIPFTPDPSGPLPDTLTWAVHFTGQGTAGLLIADAPTIGFSYDDYWEFDGGVWTGRQLVGGYTSNFEAKVTAIAVPESTPGMTLAVAFAGFSALTVYRRTRRNQI